MPLGHCTTMVLAGADGECGIVAIPLAPDKLKANTWYYGLHCDCSRLHALCEDLFAGKGDEQHLDCSDLVEVSCECGAVTRADRLHEFKTP